MRRSTWSQQRWALQFCDLETRRGLPSRKRHERRSRGRQRTGRPLICSAPLKCLAPQWRPSHRAQLPLRIVPLGGTRFEFAYAPVAL
jgi:hypothetical protein